MKKSTLVLWWTARAVAALIMVQTLFFKFTGAEESIYIFTQVGMEPWGRFLIGFLELIASAMLLINRSAFHGAVLGLGLMAGAIGMHLTMLGIEVMNDGGYLFILALIVAICCSVVILLSKKKVTALLRGEISELLNFGQ
jgi:putative oxidoreductase